MDVDALSSSRSATGLVVVPGQECCDVHTVDKRPGQSESQLKPRLCPRRRMRHDLPVCLLAVGGRDRINSERIFWKRAVEPLR